MNARYAHTNLIAKDWQALARFYEDVFGCVLAPPERDLKGPQMDAGTGVPGAHVRGVHLRLPGFADGGPTLEIFSYNVMPDHLLLAINRPGLGHIAFAVDDVAAARRAVLAAGGRPVGEVVTTGVSTGATVTWCYVTDLEGNIIELQAWANPVSEITPDERWRKALSISGMFHSDRTDVAVNHDEYLAEAYESESLHR